MIMEVITQGLHYLCKCFHALGEIEKAKLASLWSLDNVLMTQRHPKYIAQCFSTAIKVHVLHSKTKYVIILIKSALRVIFTSTSMHTLDIDTINEISMLYESIMCGL
jgi:hypothetical protein